MPAWAQISDTCSKAASVSSSIDGLAQLPPARICSHSSDSLPRIDSAALRKLSRSPGNSSSAVAEQFKLASLRAMEMQPIPHLPARPPPAPRAELLLAAYASRRRIVNHAGASCTALHIASFALTRPSLSVFSIVVGVSKRHTVWALTFREKSRYYSLSFSTNHRSKDP